MTEAVQLALIGLAGQVVVPVVLCVITVVTLWLKLKWNKEASDNRALEAKKASDHRTDDVKAAVAQIPAAVVEKVVEVAEVVIVKPAESELPPPGLPLH
jgi:hypothetical protein